MKKTIILILMLVAALLLVTSCNIRREETTDTGKNGAETTDAASDLTSDTGDEGGTNDNAPADKQRPIHITSGEIDHSYYRRINGFESVITDGVGSIFPKEDGFYFMLIGSRAEMEKYIKTDLVGDDLFSNNYLMLFNAKYDYTYYGEENVGYHGLTLENGEYKMTLDWYQNPIGRDYIESVSHYDKTECLIVPKSEIKYASGVKNVEISANEISYIKDLDYISTSPENNLPTESGGFIVNRDSEKIVEFNISPYYFTNVNSLLLYIKGGFENSVILTGKEVKNGDLYLTFTEYTHIKEYSSTELFDLKINTEELSSDFEIHITVNQTVIPIPEWDKITVEDENQYRKLLTDEQKELLRNALLKDYENYTETYELFIEYKDGNVRNGTLLTKYANGIYYVSSVVDGKTSFYYQDFEGQLCYKLTENGIEASEGILHAESFFPAVFYGNILKDVDIIRYDSRWAHNYYYLESTSDHTEYYDIRIYLNGENLEKITLYKGGSMDTVLMEYVEISLSNIGSTTVTLPTEGAFEKADENAQIGEFIAKKIAEHHYINSVGYIENSLGVSVFTLNGNKYEKYPDMDKYWYVEVIEWQEGDFTEWGVPYIYKIDKLGAIVEIK